MPVSREMHTERETLEILATDIDNTDGVIHAADASLVDLDGGVQILEGMLSTSETGRIRSISTTGETALIETEVILTAGDVFKPSCPADLNGDDSVGFADLQELLQNWGECPMEGDCQADLNGDGSVGFADLQELLQNWGPCPIER